MRDGASGRRRHARRDCPLQGESGSAVLRRVGVGRSVSQMDMTLAVDAAGGVAVKLQADEWEVNFRASRAELVALSGIRSADWNARRSIRAGESAGAPVFWASDGNVT